MFALFILYITCISNLSLINEYENKIEDESKYDDAILKKLKENMLIDDKSIFDFLRKGHSLCFNSCNEDFENIIFLNLLDKFDCAIVQILNYILKRNTDSYLLKFIFNIELNKHKDMSNYLVSSVYLTLLIQNLIIVTSTDKEIEENVDDLVKFLKYVLNDNLFNLFVKKMCKDDKLGKKLRIYSNSWIFLYTKYFLEICKKYELILDNYLKYLNVHDFYQVERSLDVPFFRTRYYYILNERIDCFEDVSNDKFYFLFNHKGFKYNRITNLSITELYINNFYKTFMKYDDFYETELENTDIDISYLQGKVFHLYTKEFFEYVMGLLQYVSCSYKKHIICLYKRNLLEIEIVNTDNVPLEMILDYYKSKNDLTNKIREESETYSNKYFVSIVEGKEYRFTKQDGDIKVNSKCLLLNCSHILGNELLIEYFSNFFTRCHLCNDEFEVIGYFEVNLFTNL